MAHTFPGKLVVIEGIDGSGKSSLISSLHKRLSGTLAIVCTKEPGGSELGKHLRKLLQHQPIAIAPRAEYLLFAADRAQHFHDVVIPALKEGALVISDRMSDSSLAYQGYGRGHTLDIIHNINAWTMHNMQADLTLYVRISVEEASARMQKRNETATVFEKQKKEFMERVAHGFDEIYKTRDDVTILNASDSHESLVNQAYALITKIINAK